MRPPLDLVEYGPARLVDLSRGEYETLAELGIVKVDSKSTNRYTIKPGGKVGSVRLGDLQINVKPKITELKRLLFFIGYCSSPAIWREEFVQLEKADGLFPAVAESFVRLTTRALERGLLQGYGTRADQLPVLRGRVRFHDQTKRNFGLPVPIAVEYDDFTFDIPENQIVLLATLRLLGLPDIGADARHRLGHIRKLLDDVTVYPKRSATPRWKLNRLNARYQDVLRLSEVILDNSSFHQMSGSLTVSGFMVEMWRVYEDFVEGALKMSMRPFGGHAKAQHEQYLDKASRVRFRPDIIWFDSADNPIAVVDVKYKAQRINKFPEADLYQMLAYCSALGLKEGHLVYAKGNESPRVHEINNCGITVYCHALDLGSPPDVLLESIEALAKLIVSDQSTR
ncbi:McrC family protein [Nocardia sp. NPDC003482]